MDTGKEFLAEIETSSFATWHKKTGCVNYKNGKNLRKDSIGMAIAYCPSLGTIEITSNPDNSDYSTTTQTTFEYAIQDFALIDENKIFTVGKMGQVNFRAYKGSGAGMDFAEFNLELDKNEMVTCLAVCNSDRFIAICTQKRGKCSRIFLYERKYESVIMLLDTFDVHESMFEKEGGVIVEMNFELTDEDTPLLVAFEQEEAGSVRVFKIFAGVFNELAYHRDFFFGIYRCSRVHMNSLWTLDHLGFLKMTPLNSILMH